MNPRFYFLVYATIFALISFSASAVQVEKEKGIQNILELAANQDREFERCERSSNSRPPVISGYFSKRDKEFKFGTAIQSGGRLKNDDKIFCQNSGRKLKRQDGKIYKSKKFRYFVSRVNLLSNYVNYHFIETQEIKNTSGTISLVPVFRVFSPEGDLKIPTTKPAGKFILIDQSIYKNFQGELARVGGLDKDVVFEKMSARADSRILGSFNKDDRYVAIFIPNFFVKPSSVITIEHHYSRPSQKGLNSWYSYGEDFFVQEVQPFSFFPTTAWASFEGQVKFSAYLDGNLIHEKSYEILEPNR